MAKEQNYQIFKYAERRDSSQKNADRKKTLSEKKTQNALEMSSGTENFDN